MKKLAFFLTACVLVACQPQTKEQISSFPNGTWIDLTYNFDEQTIFWPTGDPFRLDTVFAGTTDGGYHYEAYSFCLAEHGGTHLDAPVHFAEGKWSVEQIPLENCMGEAIVIDVSAKALPNHDYQISVEDVSKWEEANRSIPEGAMLLFRTAYGQFWPDKESYMGTAERGAEAVPKLHFPGISPDLARWLVKNRNIKAVGLDTPSIDYGQSKLFESHQILYAANILGFENLANLDQMPEQGSWLMALPMKIKGGSGGPLRVVAMLPKD
ncbi:MAG: cyclase family protein [Bacteroidia bacterium]